MFEGVYLNIPYLCSLAAEVYYHEEGLISSKDLNIMTVAFILLIDIVTAIIERSYLFLH